MLPPSALLSRDGETAWCVFQGFGKLDLRPVGEPFSFAYSGWCKGHPLRQVWYKGLRIRLEELSKGAGCPRSLFVCGTFWVEVGGFSLDRQMVEID